MLASAGVHGRCSQPATTGNPVVSATGRWPARSASPKLSVKTIRPFDATATCAPTTGLPESHTARITDPSLSWVSGTSTLRNSGAGGCAPQPASRPHRRISATRPRSLING